MGFIEHQVISYLRRAWCTREWELGKAGGEAKNREVHSGGTIVSVGGQAFSSQCSARVSGAAGGDGETDGEGILQVDWEKWDL